MTTFDTYILNAFEVLSTAAKATTPKDELTPEEAAEAEAEIAAENAIKAARKKALRGDYYFTFIFYSFLKYFPQLRKSRRLKPQQIRQMPRRRHFERRSENAIRSLRSKLTRF